MDRFTKSIGNLIASIETVEYSESFCRIDDYKNISITDLSAFVNDDNLILPEKILVNGKHDINTLITIDEPAYVKYKNVIRNLYFSEWYFGNAVMLGFDKDPNSIFPNLENAYLKYNDKQYYNNSSLKI